MSPANAELRLDLGTPEAVTAAMAALGPDNEGFARMEQDGTVLVVTADADGAMGLLRTLDDVLGCLRALEHE